MISNYVAAIHPNQTILEVYDMKGETVSATSVLSCLPLFPLLHNLNFPCFPIFFFKKRSSVSVSDSECDVHPQSSNP